MTSEPLARRTTSTISGKRIANHPPTLQRTWAMLKEVMAGPGELDPLVRELIYIAVSVTNGCDYCIASHGAAAVSKGMTDAMYRRVDEHCRCCQYDQSLGNWIPSPFGREIQAAGLISMPCRSKRLRGPGCPILSASDPRPPAGSHPHTDRKIGISAHDPSPSPSPTLEPSGGKQ